MILLFQGNPLSHAFSVALYAFTWEGFSAVHVFGVLHHTLVGCMAFARMIDQVTPYLVGCIGR